MAGFNTINQLYLPLKDMFRSNQNLLKYIAYNEDNPLDQPDIEDIENLFDSKIYFRPKALNTITEKGTNVITTFKAIPTRNSLSYNDFLITFLIIVNNDLLLLSDEQNCFRAINIASLIDDYLNGTKGEYLGKIQCEGLLPITDTNDSFSGYTLTYRLTNFSGRKYTNSNTLV